MSGTVDKSGRLSDPEAEVRKLQKLVQKLTEERNQYLHNNTDHILQQNIDLSENSDSYKKQDIDKLKYGLADISLDDVELLDVTSLENLEEEDTWLLKSPRKPSPSQQRISPYKWVREEFDRPSPEVESARRSLLYRLDELTRMPRSPSAGTLSLGSPMSIASNTSGSNHLSHVASTGSMPFIRQPLLGFNSKQAGSKFDSGTFTRPKKNQNVNQRSNRDSPSPGNSPRDTPERNNNANYDYNNVDENANGHSGESTGSLDSLGTTHKLSDVTDVQVVARMQEESLRQSMNSPYLSTRKTILDENPDDPDLDMYDPDADPAMSRSLNRSTGGLMDSLDNSNYSNRSSPGRYDHEMMSQVKRSNNSLASLSSHSNSPPSSPYGSQYLEQKTQVIQNDHGHRNSLPNLTRGPPGGSHLPSHGSESRLRERDTPSPSSRRQPPARTQTYRVSPNRQLRTPAARGSNSPLRTLSPNREGSPSRLSPSRTYSPQRTMSPQRTKAQRAASPGRTLSPQRSGIPAPGRTGIPRGPNTKLPTPRRSSIPSVRRPLTTPRSNDDSWKDGCY